MQTLKLADDLLPLVDDWKQMTIRKGRRDIQLGDLVLENVSGTDKREVVVTEVRHKRVKDITRFEAQSDGFSSVLDLMDGMKRFYPDLDRETEVTIVLWVGKD